MSVTEFYDRSMAPLARQAEYAKDARETVNEIGGNRKADAILRKMQTTFAVQDRAPAGYYRLIASNFPYAGAVSRENGADVKPHLVWPSSDLRTYSLTSLYNLSAMVDDMNSFAQRVTITIQQGIEFIKEDADEMRLWSDSRQTDLSECYHAAYAVQYMACKFSEEKHRLQSLHLRAKEAFCRVICGKGVAGMPPESGDFYNIAAQSDAMDMASGDFPKGVQAFGHPRIVSQIEVITSGIKEKYVELLNAAVEVRSCTQHLLSVINGPHGSIYRSMRDHSSIAKLTQWMNSLNSYFATLTPLHAIVVDADLHSEWQRTVEQQWRELPELLDECHSVFGRTAKDGTVKALRMPPIQLLLKLKLSYDFSNRTYIRSLLTYADTFLYKQHVSGNGGALCYASTADDGFEFSVKATDNIDPSIKNARLMTAPNGLFVHDAFNEDVVVLLVQRLLLPEIMRLMFSSRVFYMLISKQARFWTHLTNMFLIKHRAQISISNGAPMLENIKFKPDYMPRLHGSAFSSHYFPFYCLIGTLSIRANAGKFHCNICLKLCQSRSPIHKIVMCTECYHKHTITAIEAKKERTSETREWYRHSTVLRTLLDWQLENRPTLGNSLHMDMVFDRTAFQLAMMQMSHLSKVLSHAHTNVDVLSRLEDEIELRYLLGGPHAQIREPRVVKLCSNFYHYAARQYGVAKVNVTNGHSVEAIRRFMGNYSKPRQPEIQYHMYGPNAKKITVKLTEPESIDLTNECTYPYYYKKHVPGQPEVYRVNRPFTVMTAAQPRKMCQVVATNSIQAGGENGLPLCECCYARAFKEGVNGMMVETDDDEEVNEEADE
tara:strand:+ start:2083 stop:4572 length:2490 start_codon:yes stop_codon:yes gene_type:complete